MVSIRNVEKFVKDHPELFSDNKDEVLAKAKAAADKDGIMSGSAVKGFMCEFTEMFFFEATHGQEHIIMGLEDISRSANRPNIPKDKNYPEDSVQCNKCGGWGCKVCQDKGWLTPKNHPDGRKCEREACGKAIPPNYLAIYCTNDCARLDA